MQVIDTRTYETLYTLRHGDYRSVLNWSAAVWSPSNTYVAAGSGNNALMIWDVRVRVFHLQAYPQTRRHVY